MTRGSAVLVLFLPALAFAQARPVFSFHDNRLLAHQLDDGALVVHAGSATFSRYIRFGHPKGAWALRQKVERRRVARLDKGGTIEVPLSAGQAQTAKRIHVRLHSAGERRLEIRVGGLKHRLKLHGGWETIDVGAGTLVAGENAIELKVKKGAIAIEWLQIGGTPPAAAPPPIAADGGAFTLPKGDGLAWYVFVPPAARLVGDVTGPACQVTVSATAQDGRAGGRLTGRGGSVDLAPLAGKVARVELVGDGCAEARLERAALAIGGAEPKVKKGNPPRYIVFWIMDTLRADRVRPWQPDARAQVPNFEKLASESTVFKNAYVQGNASTTSHASMWTSLFPINHRVISAGEGWEWKIADELPHLGELVKQAGFFLSGVTANGFITAQAGYDEGFDKYTNLMREMNPDRVNGAVPGEKLLQRALATVKGKVGQPFLLFIGTIDTHAPWIAHEPWISLYDPGPYKGKFKKKASGGGIGVKKGRMISLEPPEPRDLQRLHALYDADISYQDALVGKLVATLEQWGILDETMIIITADHGEELFEDGRGGHGGSLRETLVHVPLLIHYPPLFPAVAVDEGVDNLDLLPTILDALGQPVPEALQGQSLLPLAHGVGRGYPRPSFSSMYEYAHAMRIAGWKMRVGKTGIPDLYHVAVDPLEKKQLNWERPIERRFLTDAFALFLANQVKWKKARWGVASNMTALAAEEIEGR